MNSKPGWGGVALEARSSNLEVGSHLSVCLKGEENEETVRRHGQRLKLCTNLTK
jgi:hypothetical protein